jgi:hypothetical protein
LYSKLFTDYFVAGSSEFMATSHELMVCLLNRITSGDNRSGLQVKRC